MKKLLVIAFAAILALSMVAVASAAEITTSIGGDFYFLFDSDQSMIVDNGQNFTCGSITGKLTEGNTWAKLWLNLDSWTNNIGNQTGTGTPNAMHYAFGVDKIADVFSFFFSTKDTNLCGIGMASLTDSFNDFKTDAFFNTNGFGGNLGFSVDTDAFAARAEVVVLDQPDIQTYAINGTFKFNSGSVYAGYERLSDADGDYDYIVGLKYNTGDYKFTGEFWGNTHKGSQGVGDLDNTVFGTEGNAVQFNVAYQNLNATLLYTMPDPEDGVIGVGASYTIPDTKWTVGAKYFTTEDSAWEVYGLYDAGAFDVKVGAVDPGTNDVYGIIGVHASIW